MRNMVLVAFMWAFFCFYLEGQEENFPHTHTANKGTPEMFPEKIGSTAGRLGFVRISDFLIPEIFGFLDGFGFRILG
jgi:hypothetical protein